VIAITSNLFINPTDESQSTTEEIENKAKNEDVGSNATESEL
jgi:hypothetical protein